MESREATDRWFTMVRDDLPSRRTIERNYTCPECGPFVVYHKNYASVNRECHFCGSRVRLHRDATLILAQPGAFRPVN